MLYPGDLWPAAQSRSPVVFGASEMGVSLFGKQFCVFSLSQAMSLVVWMEYSLQRL